jgi:DNA-binding CsgD family transcriptional regulator
MRNGRPVPGGTLGLLGRRSESALLDGVVAAVRQGESRTLLLRGEAGVGKTALLDTLLSAASDLEVVRASGVESEMELAFASLQQLCAPMLDWLGLLPSPQRHALEVAFGLSEGTAPNRFLVGLAVLTLLSEVADERPLLGVIDDAQWLDRASAQTLAFVARRLLAERVGLVFAARECPEELRGVPQFEVRGLGERDARALLMSEVRFPLSERVRDQIVAESRGNPLALLELPRGMSAAELAVGFGLLGANTLSGRIEDSFVRRLAALPEETRRLLLIAAAEPVGDALLLWRAAERLGVAPAAAGVAEAEGLLAIDERVRFRHPLVRSAAYREATPGDRRRVHEALAEVSDPELDADRRAWHRALAAAGPAEDVAAELERSAARAQTRGGLVAAAAFLARATALTVEPAPRAQRALSAACAKFGCGDFAAAESLLGRAEAGPLNELDRAKLQLTRAQMSFDQQRGRDAPRLLLQAAQRLVPLDAELARETYLEALVAAIYAGRLATGSDVAEVAEGARSAPIGPEPLPAKQLLLLGLAIRLTDGCAAAQPILRRALDAYRDEERRLDRMCLAYNIAAEELWDDEAWLELSTSQAELARATGTLLLLPYALDYLAGVYVQRGDLSVAGRLLAEAEGLGLGVRPEFPLRLAAFRGQPAVALPLVEVMNRGALTRGEGCAIAAVGYDEAVLYNGLGQYKLALEAAQKAIATDDIVTSSWTLYELAEAATRAGERDVARDAADRLSDRTAALTSAWAVGAALRSRALVADGAAAEDLHRQAVECLDRSPMVWFLARARLSFGEWLRRENRRADAREQLRAAYETFASIGAEAFAERARRELMATGEIVRARTVETRDDLTAQERQIAELARDGLSNPEIAARHFLSARTVEWHLHKVFGKLGISSRKELHEALRPSENEMFLT